MKRKITELSVIIPCNNEGKRIRGTLQTISSYLSKRGIDYELIVVDDGSMDGTASSIKEFMKKNKRVILLENEKNKGKGFSVRRGMQKARFAWALFTDADLSAPIEMLERLEEHITAYDVIIGSRNMPDSEKHIRQPFTRALAGKIFPFFVRLFLASGIHDTQCGFKLFSKKTIRPLFSRQHICGWAFDAEIMHIARERGFKIKEVGVVWKNDRNSKIRLLRDSFHMFCDVMRIRMNAWKGIYRR